MIVLLIYHIRLSFSTVEFSFKDKYLLGGDYTYLQSKFEFISTVVKCVIVVEALTKPRDKPK